MRIILFLWCMLFFDIAFAAADIAIKNKELSEVRDRIKQVALNIEQIREKKERLHSQLAEIEKNYGVIALTLKQLAEQASNTRQQLTEIRQNINKQRQNIDRHKKGLQGQIRAAHALGKSEKLKLLLNQQDPALSSRMMVYYDYFNRARLAKLEEITASLSRLNELEKEQMLQSARLQKLQEQKTVEQNALLETKQQRELFLTKLNKDQLSKQQQLNKLLESEQRLQQLIAALQKALDDYPVESGPGKPFLQKKGQLPWPIKGKLVKTFGSRRSESRWDGVLIAADEGDDIRAISRGRVVYADWLRGYGLLVIIDHGKGYMTLYAFNQSLYKSVGDWVEAGDIIASVGNSGGRERVGLYFGIRNKGKPVDPVQWCKKQRR